jgi:hypothetical protein
VGTDFVRLRRVNAATASCLLEVPGILEQAKSGPAHERLFPMPTTDHAKINEDWQQFVVPELERLFASAGEILAKDIEPLLQKKKELVLPVAHCDAWVSAINQARLILGAQHAVTEQDMEESRFALLPGAKQQALLRIHVLGYIVQVFVEFLSGEQASSSA